QPQPPRQRHLPPHPRHPQRPPQRPHPHLVSWSKGDRFTPVLSLSYTWNVAKVTSEISSSAKGVTAVPGDSMAATDPFAGNKASPATPRPATPKVDRAFLDRLPLAACFICDI